MNCPQCQQTNPVAARFCQHCGQALPRRCVQCSCALAAEARFCHQCGTPAGSAPAASVPAAPPPLPRGGDRRQAAILFADVVGYTALCARHDPEQIQAMLGRFFAAMDAVIAACGGTVFDRAGDAVMAVFGAPVAHGNDAQRAVRAALDMHAAAAGLSDCDGRPLVLHIGLASGEVVAAAIAGAGTSKYSVTGEPVNLAARLDALAGPGETLISDALYRRVADDVDALALGERNLKGLAAPVMVWQLRALRSARSSRLGFVGRQAELAQLGGVLASVHGGGSGVAVVVRGDAGIGKSRLVEECRALATAQGFDSVCGQVLDFGVARGQDALPTVLKAWLGVAAPEDEAARRQALQAALDDGLVAPDEELFIGELLDLTPLPSQKADFDALDNATRLRRSGEALGAVARRAAQRQPRLVCVEDVHWASADLLRQLAALASAAAQAPIVLLLTSRIEGDPLDKAWRAAIHGCPMLTLDLAPLRAQDAQLLARSLVDASSRFAMQCIERAEGNPLFLEQLLRGARETEAAGVPPTIQSLVLERMDRLAGADRLALQVASVIGKRFALDALRAIGGDPRLDCQALMTADLVRSDGRDHQFAHALIQEAVYGSTLKSQRRDWHRAAAQWFGAAEPVLRAEHLDRADDPQAVAAYLSAAQQLAERFRYDGALDLLARGLARAAALGSEPAVVCALALLHGDLLREAGRSAESIAAFDSALGLAPGDGERCQAWLGLARGHRVTGHFAPAMQALEQAQPLAERLAQDDLLSQIHNLRGNLLFAQGQVGDCQAEHTLALACALRCDSRIREVQALSGLGDAHYAQGRMSSALAQFRRCVETSEAQGWIRIEIPNRVMTAFCLLFCGQGAEAAREARRANDDAERIGVVPNRIFSMVGYAQVLHSAARFDECAALCESALALARGAGNRRYEINALDMLARVDLVQGRRDLARQRAGQAFEISAQIGHGFAGAWLCGLRARCAADAAEREQMLAEGEALLSRPALAHSLLWFYRDAIDACQTHADWPRVRRYADALSAFVSAEPLAWAGLVVACGRALADAAQGQDKPAALQRLHQLRDDASAAQARWLLPAIDAGLARA